MKIEEQLKLIKASIDKISLSLITDIKTISPNLSMSSKRRLLSRMKRYRSNKIEETFSAIFLYAIYEPDNAITEARLKGVFRYKGYGFESNRALHLLELIKENADFLSFSESTMNFIESKIHCSPLWSIYKKTENQIIKAIKKANKENVEREQDGIKFESSLYKELLVFIEIFFIIDKRPLLISELMDKNQLAYYSKEQVSSAISYIVFLYDKTIGIDRSKHYIINSDRVFSKELEKIVLNACKVQLLEEYELRVDYLKYSVKNKHKELIFYSSSSNIEKSFRLGFINKEIQNIQWYKNHISNNNNDAENKSITFDNFINHIIENSKVPLIREKNELGMNRYVFGIPEIIVQDVLKQIDYFEEEFIEITNEMKEILDDELENKMITKHATVRDLVLFQRYFRIINALITNLLSQKKFNKEKHKIANSLVPQIKSGQLRKQLSFFIENSKAVDELLELLTYNEAYKLDLQYTPLIFTQDGYSCPSQIIAKSNLLRNVIVNAYLRSKDTVNNSFDGFSLEKSVINMFRYVGYKVYTNLNFTYDGDAGEIDVLVTNGEFFLFIECKSPFEPTSLFETRSLLQNVKKADKQLDLIKKAFEDSNFAKSYFLSRNIDYIENNTIKTCIILGSRLFSGSSLAKHPIRSIQGFPNMLLHGTIEGDVGIWKFWKNGTYCDDDLFNYLDDENSLISYQLDSMNKTYESFKTNGYKISLETFTLNNLNLMKTFDKKLTILDLKEAERNELFENLEENTL